MLMTWLTKLILLHYMSLEETVTSALHTRLQLMASQHVLTAIRDLWQFAVQHIHSTCSHCITEHSTASTAPSDSTNAGGGFTAKLHSFQLLQQYNGREVHLNIFHEDFLLWNPSSCVVAAAMLPASHE